MILDGAESLEVVLSEARAAGIHITDDEAKALLWRLVGCSVQLDREGRADIRPLVRRELGIKRWS